MLVILIWTYWCHNVMDVWHTSFVYIIFISFKILTPGRHKSKCSILVQFQLSTRSHFFTSSLLHFFTSSMILPALQNLFQRMSSLRTPNRWKSETEKSGLCGGLGRTVHLSFSNNSLLSETPFWRRSAHAREKVLFRGAAAASGAFKIHPRKKLRRLLSVLTKVQKVLQHFLGTFFFIECLPCIFIQM